MNENKTFLDELVTAIQQAGMYDKNDQTPPAAVLWPDKERQWEALIPALRTRLPLLTLGAYAPKELTGPSYWIRCMIARTLPDEMPLPTEGVAVIYLPGVGRGDLRAIEDCPVSLQPLAELQYRGVLWTQKNGHDWTLSAFLQTKSGGLGLEVASDQATKEALKRALLKLADEPVEKLQKEAPLKAAYLDSLLNPDEPRSLLLWLNDQEGYRLKVNPEEWQAFCNVCNAKYKFHPEKDGPLTGAQLLGFQTGAWGLVWKRFKESPRAYAKLPGLLRQARLPQLGLYDISESWPQDNEAAEEQLQQGLAGLPSFTFQDARAAVAGLEETHGMRRNWVWAALGNSPLALALEPLATLARLTEKALVGTSVPEIAQAYLDWGWRVDQAALDALTLIQAPGTSMEDIKAVKAAVRALYMPWLEGAANNLQKIILAGPTTETYPYEALQRPEKGTCILFSDALRLDAGQKLAAALALESYSIVTATHLAALPTITSTAKFAFSPAPAHALREVERPRKISGVSAKYLTPLLAGSKTDVTAEAFRKILEEEGFQILRGEDLGDPSGLAWTEMGEIDAYGHEHGCKLAVHLLGELSSLRNRIENLLDYGWKQVVVVTDHGWLLMPDGLPKAHLPEHLTEIRKGRCARLKEGAQTDQQSVAWFWDQDVRVAIAPGICCYEAGKEYEHGGISPQECFTPLLTIRKAAVESIETVSIEAIKWRGLRFSAKINGAQPGMMVDIRLKAGDPATSVVKAPASPAESGTVSLVIEDADHLEAAAFVVVIAANGQACAQMLTTIGE